MKTQIMSSLVTLALASTAFAGEMQEEWNPMTNLDGSVEVKSHFDYKQSDNKDDADFRATDVEIKAQVKLTEQLKVVIKAELEQYFEDNGIVVLNAKSVEKAIEHAYIVFEPAPGGNGLLSKIVFGKHRVAFGTDLAYTAMYQDSPYYQIARQDEVMGVTLVLRPKFVDYLAVSLFETGEGDLDIADELGASFNAYKKLGNGLVAQLSGMWKESATGSDDELRGNIGLIWKSGRMTFYANGSIMENHPVYGDALAGAIGATIKLSQGLGRVGAEASYIEDYAAQFAVYWLFAPFNTDAIQIGPEVRYTMYDNPVIIAGKSVDEDLTYGVRVTVKATAGNVKKKSLWKGDDNNGPL